MRTEQGQAYDLPRDGLDQIMYQQNIAQRLRHFRLVHTQEAVVHPVTSERCTAMRAATLRHFVFVVRKYEVTATCVNIDRVTQVFFSHRGTLDVPARTAPAPRRIPAWQLRRRWFPQDEVVCCFLVRRNLDPRPGDHLPQISLGQRPVFFIR